MADEILIAGSVLGSRVDTYSEQEKMWIFQIANRLKGRDDRVKGVYRQDMGLYVRAAGLVYELAKKLDAASTQSRFTRKTMDDWLSVITGIHFDFITTRGSSVDGNKTLEEGGTIFYGEKKAERAEEKKEAGQGEGEATEAETIDISNPDANADGTIFS